MQSKTCKLVKLNARMEASCKCALKSTALTAVSGEGDANARIMFVGEAPGKSEDETGTPFVGAAGKVLDLLLHSISLERSDVYITNVVKFRPPGNRDPTPAEVSDCWPWLVAQIALIDPDIIVPLGRHALERFVPGRKVSLDHGQVFVTTLPDIGEKSYYALYHPAAALYNPKLRGTLFEDFERIPVILKDRRK